MTALGVVEHLRNLASDPQNRATIVKVRNLKCIPECPVLGRPCLFYHLKMTLVSLLFL